MNKKQLEALFLAMLAKAGEHQGLLSDMQMQLQQLRTKYAFCLAVLFMTYIEGCEVSVQ